MTALPPPPADLDELLDRARALAGRNLAELSARLGVRAPADLKRHKGWIGELIEQLLGATAKSRIGPDFPELGVELKTLPLRRDGRPLESTFVCTIELAELEPANFRASRVYAKLAQVLWVPILADRELAPGLRTVGTPFLWRPSSEEFQVLEADWTELSTEIALGRAGDLTAHRGQALQVRPKARTGSSRRLAFDEDGGMYEEQPKGFYLRAGFTEQIVRQQFRLTPEAAT